MDSTMPQLRPLLTTIHYDRIQGLTHFIVRKTDIQAMPDKQPTMVEQYSTLSLSSILDALSHLLIDEVGPPEASWTDVSWSVEVSSFKKLCQNDTYRYLHNLRYDHLSDTYYYLHNLILRDENPQLEELIQTLLLLEYLALLLQNSLQYLLLFCKFAEFPNRHRPKCTTMPWNIWPSLVILWGVCWMFYPSPPGDTPNQFLFNDEHLLSLDHGKTPSYTIESSAKLISTSQPNHLILHYPHFRRVLVSYRKISIGSMTRPSPILGLLWGMKPLKILIWILLDNRVSWTKGFERLLLICLIPTSLWMELHKLLLINLIM